MATVYRVKRFGAYDQFDYTSKVDSLKRMRDSEILTEEREKGPGYGGVVRATGAGALVGAGAGAAIAGGLHVLSNRKGGVEAMTKGLGEKALKAGKWGAGIGAVAAGINAWNKRSEESDKVNHYNRRLAYAQRRANARERADWKANMGQRDGYSY